MMQKPMDGMQKPLAREFIVVGREFHEVLAEGDHDQPGSGRHPGRAKEVGCRQKGEEDRQERDQVPRGTQPPCLAQQRRRVEEVLTACSCTLLLLMKHIARA